MHGHLQAIKVFSIMMDVGRRPNVDGDFSGTSPNTPENDIKVLLLGIAIVFCPIFRYLYIFFRREVIATDTQYPSISYTYIPPSPNI